MSGIANGSELPDAILFDLDGTLIDSAPDIAAAVNELIADHDLEPLDVPSVRAMIGNGVGKLVERAFAARGKPLDGNALDGEIALMMDIYGRHLTNLTTVYPGALETVAQFAGAGVRTAIVSNKPMAFTAAIARHYGFAAHVAALQGAEDHLPKKPAPDMLFAALDKARARNGRAIMVGDSHADVEAARNARIPVVLIRGGYTSVPVEALGADAIAESFADLAAAIGRVGQMGYRAATASS